MSNAIVEGLSVVDATGHLILAAIVLSLMAAIAANLYLRVRYAKLQADLLANRSTLASAFGAPLLQRVVRDANEAVRKSGELNAQAIVEEGVQAELGGLLLLERFVRAATGLVIILGLLGTFYGLTLSIGKLVQLVSADAGATLDVTQAVTTGLTQALSGMAVAFSNSLLGVASAVVLTVVGVFSNVTDRRTAFMVEVETYLERTISRPKPEGGGLGTSRLETVVADFGASVAKLDDAMGRFDASLQAFAGSTREFQEFNLHLKDNVQRMSLSFGDFSEALRGEIAALKGKGRS